MSLVQLGPLKFDSKPARRATIARRSAASTSPCKSTSRRRRRTTITSVGICCTSTSRSGCKAGDWFLEVRTPCRHLLPDNRCEIYHTRPQICREYGWPDAESPDEPCEYFTGDGGYDLYFETRRGVRRRGRGRARASRGAPVEAPQGARRRRSERDRRAAVARALRASRRAPTTATDVYKQMGISRQRRHEQLGGDRACAPRRGEAGRRGRHVSDRKERRKPTPWASGSTSTGRRATGSSRCTRATPRKENGGYVGRGEVAILDLDGDGVSEIGLYYDNLKNDLIQERRLGRHRARRHGVSRGLERQRSATTRRRRCATSPPIGAIATCASWISPARAARRASRSS